MSPVPGSIRAVPVGNKIRIFCVGNRFVANIDHCSADPAVQRSLIGCRGKIEIGVSDPLGHIFVIAWGNYDSPWWLRVNGKCSHSDGRRAN